MKVDEVKQSIYFCERCGAKSANRKVIEEHEPKCDYDKLCERYVGRYFYLTPYKEPPSWCRITGVWKEISSGGMESNFLMMVNADHRSKVYPLENGRGITTLDAKQLRTALDAEVEKYIEKTDEAYRYLIEYEPPKILELGNSEAVE